MNGLTGQEWEIFSIIPGGDLKMLSVVDLYTRKLADFLCH